MSNHVMSVCSGRGIVRECGTLSREDRREIRGLFGRGIRRMANDARALRRVEPVAMATVSGGVR